jgi:hypothetical protein
MGSSFSQTKHTLVNESLLETWSMEPSEITTITTSTSKYITTKYRAVYLEIPIDSEPTATHPTKKLRQDIQELNDIQSKYKGFKNEDDVTTAQKDSNIIHCNATQAVKNIIESVFDSIRITMKKHKRRNWVHFTVPTSLIPDIFDHVIFTRALHITAVCQVTDETNPKHNVTIFAIQFRGKRGDYIPYLHSRDGLKHLYDLC